MSASEVENRWRDSLSQAVSNQDAEKFHMAVKQLPNGKALLQTDQYFLNSLIRRALQFENDELLDAFLQYGAIGKSLMYTSSDGSLSRVQKILEKIENLRREHPDQNYLGPSDFTNTSRFKTPLMIAIEMKNYDVVEYFVRKGYDKIDILTDDGIAVQQQFEDDAEIERGTCCGLTRCCNPFKFMIDTFGSFVKTKEDDKEEKRAHLRVESYRACTNPFYISYKFIYGKDEDTVCNPLYYLLHLNQKLQEQAWIDDEFKDDYESLSDQCQNFIEELMNQCRSTSEKKILTDVLPDIKRKKMEKYTAIQSRRHEVRDLAFLNLAMKTNCDKLIAHPFNQLQLNSVVYPNMATWKKRTTFSVFMFTLRHFLLLPFLAIVFVFLSCENGITRYMRNPMVKFMSHFWSMLSFVVLLVVSAFQDKFEDKLVELSIVEWLILLWLAGFIAQALVELSTQGFQRYFAQWWNWIMIAMIIVFSTSYTLRLIAYGITLKWDVLQPITNSLAPSEWYKLVLVANSFYSIAMVLSFVRLSAVFQVNEVLGPWQLSLYHLILDVLKFMLFFSIFFVAFGLSLRKLYSHYIITQKYLAKIPALNRTDTDTGHGFSSVGSGAYGLFWSLFGYTDPQSFQTKDPNFIITTETGVFLFGLFQVLAVIVAVNMLIAMMTKSFENITDNATKKWKVSRTRIWMFWVEKGSSLPPPFNLLNVCRKIMKILKKICKSSSRNTNLDFEMASQTASNGNQHERDKVKSRNERSKIRVMLQRYIENKRKMMGLPKSTAVQQENGIETERTDEIDTYYSHTNTHDHKRPRRMSGPPRTGIGSINLSFTKS